MKLLRRFPYLSTRARLLGFRKTTFNMFMVVVLLGATILIYESQVGGQQKVTVKAIDVHDITDSSYNRNSVARRTETGEPSSEENSVWFRDPFAALKDLWSSSQSTLPAMPEVSDRTKPHPSESSSTNTIMDRIEKHFNVELSQAMQNLSRRFYDPRRHVIHLRDYYKYQQFCNSSTFTLKYSNSRYCDVISTPITHYRTCAVVGNGGILMNSSCGAEIDAHDFVVRSNLPPTLAFRNDVGRKTNFTAVNYERLIQVRDQLKSANPLVLEAVLSRFRATPGMVFAYGLSLDERNHRRMTGTARTVRERGLPVSFAFAHRSYMDSKSLWFLLSGKHYLLPSTGLNVFGLASSFCDRVSLYGYFPFDTDLHGRKLPYHYYDHKLAEGVHNMRNEFTVFRTLHDLGIVRHVIDRCEPVA